MTDTIKPPLPEPVAWLHTEPSGTTVFVDADDGEGCPDCQPLFTRDQLAAAVAAAEKAEPATGKEDLQVEPLAFDHDIGVGRFQVVKGSYWWHIRIGDGTANVGKFHTKLAAEDMALKLLTAFRDGAYMQFHASPAAPAQVPQPLSDEQIERLAIDATDALPDSEHDEPTTWMWSAGGFLAVARAIERAHGIGITKETT